MMKRAIVLAMTFLCGAAAVVRANRPEQAPPRVSFDRFPSNLGDWSGQELPPMEPKILAILGVDELSELAAKMEAFRALATIGELTSLEPVVPRSQEGLLPQPSAVLTHWPSSSRPFAAGRSCSIPSGTRCIQLSDRTCRA